MTARRSSPACGFARSLGGAALRLYLALALVATAALAAASAAVYLRGGEAPAKIFLAFVCHGCEASLGLSAFLLGGVLVALAPAPRRPLAAPARARSRAFALPLDAAAKTLHH